MGSRQTYTVIFYSPYAEFTRHFCIAFSKVLTEQQLTFGTTHAL